MLGWIKRALRRNAEYKQGLKRSIELQREAYMREQVRQETLRAEQNRLMLYLGFALDDSPQQWLQLHKLLAQHHDDIETLKQKLAAAVPGMRGSND